MAITTFSELKTAIAAWADASDVTAYLGDFVTLATSMFNNGMDNIPAVRTRDMETVTSLTPVSGVCTLPSDYLQYRRVVEKNSARRDLEYLTPIQADVMYPYGDSGNSSFFTIVGNSLKMYPVSTNDIELTYYATIPDLSDSNTTNWLLTKHPSLYLHACLMQLAIFRRDDDLLARSTQITAALITGVNNSNLLANYAKAGSRPRGVVVI